MNIINGKHYPMWQGIVDNKAAFVGGTLTEYDAHAGESAPTKIIDIQLLPNGTDSAMIEVKGEAFTASCDVKYCGITGGYSIWIDTRFGTKWKLTKNNNEQ